MQELKGQAEMQRPSFWPQVRFSGGMARLAREVQARLSCLEPVCLPEIPHAVAGPVILLPGRKCSLSEHPPTGSSRESSAGKRMRMGRNVGWNMKRLLNRGSVKFRRERGQWQASRSSVAGQRRSFLAAPRIPECAISFNVLARVRFGS